MIAESLAFVAMAGAVAAAGQLAPRPAGLRRGSERRPPFALLARAGRRLLPRPAPDLLAAKAASTVLGAAAGLTAGAAMPGRLGLLLAVAAPLAGFFAPDAWAARRRRERFEEARRDLPALLDLLRVSVEAGSSLPAALAEVGRRSNATLARSWGGVAAEVAVGIPLGMALERHRRELPMPEVDAFVTTLERATRHGAPLSGTLASQAHDARFARRRAVQERAARAGPKMQLVVALLLVPSVMLLVAAALVSSLVGGGGGETFLSGF